MIYKLSPVSRLSKSLVFNAYLTAWVLFIRVQQTQKMKFAKKRDKYMRVCLFDFTPSEEDYKEDFFILCKEVPVLNFKVKGIFFSFFHFSERIGGENGIFSGLFLSVSKS